MQTTMRFLLWSMDQLARLQQMQQLAEMVSSPHTSKTRVWPFAICEKTVSYRMELHRIQSVCIDSCDEKNDFEIRNERQRDVYQTPKWLGFQLFRQPKHWNTAKGVLTGSAYPKATPADTENPADVHIIRNDVHLLHLNVIVEKVAPVSQRAMWQVGC